MNVLKMQILPFPPACRGRDVRSVTGLPLPAAEQRVAVLRASMPAPLAIQAATRCHQIDKFLEKGDDSRHTAHEGWPYSPGHLALWLPLAAPATFTSEAKIRWPTWGPGAVSGLCRDTAQAAQTGQVPRDIFISTAWCWPCCQLNM